MAETIWEKGKLRQVFEPVGRRDNGEMRYRRANFDVLEWASTATGDPQLYIVPRGTDAINGAAINVNGDDKNALGEFGFYSLSHYVLEHNVADGKKDEWPSLHYFGNI